MATKKKSRKTGKSSKKGYHFGRLKPIPLANLQAAYAKVIIPVTVTRTATQT